VKVTNHIHITLRLRMSRTVPTLPLFAFRHTKWQFYPYVFISKQFHDRKWVKFFWKKYSVSKFAYSNLNEFMNFYFKGHFIFGKCRLKVLAWTATILTEDFRRRLQLIQANTTTYPQIWLQTFHSTFFATLYFFNNFTIRHYILWDIASFLSHFCHEWYEIKSVA